MNMWDDYIFSYCTKLCCFDKYCSAPILVLCSDSFKSLKNFKKTLSSYSLHGTTQRIKKQSLNLGGANLDSCVTLILSCYRTFSLAHNTLSNPFLINSSFTPNSS